MKGGALIGKMKAGVGQGRAAVRLVNAYKMAAAFGVKGAVQGVGKLVFRVMGCCMVHNI